jgi:hypothetical protein
MAGSREVQQEKINFGTNPDNEKKGYNIRSGQYDISGSTNRVHIIRTFVCID